MTNDVGRVGDADQATRASHGAASASPPSGGYPSRIQLRRTKGWKMPPNTVKVDRSTKWGNPFGSDYPTPAEKVRRYKASLVQPPRAHPESYMGRIRDSIAELRGKSLACWCPLDQPCHADVLLELANSDSDTLPKDGDGTAPLVSGAGLQGIAHPSPSSDQPS